MEDLYPKIDIPLDHKDPYTLLIAVLLSAQSTDKGVNKITPILFAKADNPYDMIKLSVDEIRNIIKPVGLSPMKSKGFMDFQKFSLKNLMEKFQKTSMNLKNYRQLGTKLLVLLYLKHLVFPHFLLIPTFID